MPCRRGILKVVMNMKNSKEILSSILKTTQMGQSGIRSVLDDANDPQLRQALRSQLEEYDKIETQAHTIACQRGWELPELDPSIRFMADAMTRMKLKYGNADSKIAAMMIEGNTKGLIKGLKNIHQFSGDDSNITALSQKLTDSETANIRQMRPFL